MTYKELQSALKSLKSQGLTDIKLNSKKAALQAEYDRLTATSSSISDEAVKAYFNYRSVASRNIREAITNAKTVGDRKLEYDLMHQLKTGKITFRDQAGEIEAAYFQYLTLKSR